MKKWDPTLQVNLLAIFASFLWASAFLAGKITLEYLPPLHLASFRLLIAGVMLLIFTRKNPFSGLKGNIGPFLLLTFFQTIILFSAFNIGLNLVNGSFGAIIIGASPAVSSTIAMIAFKDEKVSFKKVAGLSIGVISIIVLTISKDGNIDQGTHNILGGGLLFFCNIASGLGNVIMKKKFSSFDPVRITNAQLFLGSPVVYILALIFEPHITINIPFKGIISLLYLSFITATAVSIWMGLVARKDVKISSITMWKFLIPSVGAFLNWMFNPLDNPTFLSICAIIGIVVAILISVSDNSVHILHLNYKQVEIKEPQ